MLNKVFVSAIIAAAGQGKRMKSRINKQYLELDGKPILIHTLEVFDKTELINEIILILKEDEIEFCREKILNRYEFRKKIILVSGGRERQESVYNGLKFVNKNAQIVVVHDGARPFVTADVIEKSICEALKNKAVGVGVPVKDTIKVVDENSYIIDTPDRSKLWGIQTPQVFDYDILIKAHEKAIEDNYLGTDDCVLVERLGHRVKMIEGNYDNIKITTPEDLILGEAILNRRKSKI
ncbi:2-C-methyl-D-erythritol 4-phosphate cytidylyltransferase [Caminicella sporogenes]|uniref:2-C-methyl-D-erythritol 4-phosphate cytidylyltransferase n=1 Tax=Caminicella sporogenes TaxID=166485 RepID=UPI0025401578|nr:2-C-methyl-D-erythritol 4-phosphate cytidylyltransferase [Caminicella sporogenes]WIF95625.1 2-C-methyl-D-erythritol 4-phosphate cytidylyltransferase [Caminicella sporogenes]